MKRVGFNVVQVATANFDSSSVCSVKITSVVEGKVQNTWHALINPEDWFDPHLVERHGIDNDMVACCPTMPTIRDKLQQRLRGSIVVTHTAYSRIRLERALTKYDLKPLEVIWLDSAKVVRRAWHRYSQKGYGVQNVTAELGIEYNEDSHGTALAELVLLILKEFELDLQDWIQQTTYGERPAAETITYENLPGKVNGSLHGETVVFTGKLKMARREAEQKAENVGCTVADSVTKKVTVLVVGTQIKSILKGMSKSSKHRKAEELIKQGQDIQIICETDFENLIEI